MIQLVNVNKTHKNNKYNSVHALKDINLELPDKGFVLVQGGNGSGKSTLLSILGGLDSITSGELIINNKSYTKTRQSKLDDWRGREVSYIIQGNTFNLLLDMTVAENIKMAQNVNGADVSNEEIAKRLRQVGLKGYEERNVKYLSGGEKQKVAIARALVKSPKVIIIDESGTQLDAETEKIVHKLFKEMSKNILVICTTHNSSSVENLADRIITLNDGQIFSDIKVEENQKELEIKEELKEAPNSLKTKKYRPGNFAFKMGMKNFQKNIVRSVATTIFTTLSLVIFAAALMLSQYSRFSVLANSAYKTGPYYSFGGGYTSLTEQVSLESKLNHALTNYIEYGKPNISGLIESDVNAGEVLITDFLVKEISYYNIIIYRDNLAKEPVYSVDENQIIGKYIKIYEKCYKIAGIVETDYKDYITAGTNRWIYPDEGTTRERIFNYKLDAEYKVVFVENNFAQNYINNLSGNKLNDVNVEIRGKGAFTGTFYYNEQKTVSIIGGASNIDSSLRPLQDGEIFISSNLYNCINRLTSIEMNINGMSKIFTIVGVFDTIDNETEIVLSEDDFLNGAGSIIMSSLFPSTKLLVDASNINEETLADFIEIVENNSNLKFENAYSNEINNISEKIETYKDIFLALAVFAVLLSTIFLYNYIATIIAHKKKDIGILRSLGAKSSTILSIFLTTMAAITLCTFALSVLISFVATSIINKVVAMNALGFTATIINLGLFEVSIMFSVCLFISLVATFLPIMRYSIQTPINQIKK